MLDFRSIGLKLRLMSSVTGFMLGLSCIVAGIAIGLSGAIGETRVIADVLGLSINLNDAAPGSILVLSGASAVWMTRRKDGPLAGGGSHGAKPSMAYRRK